MRGRAALGAVLLLTACTADPGVRATSRDRLPAAFDRSVPLADVTTLPDIEAITWGECEHEPLPWQCGTIEVPLDYRRADTSDSVEIAVTRLPAADPQQRIGSLVLNPGGPGGSGVDLAWSYASAFPQVLLDRFDLVGFDPRGVGRSTAVDCGDLDRTFAVVLEDCLRLSGSLLPYVGTQNAARDLEQLRKALGDDRLTYLGFSYGTALGAVYAGLFPDSVRALVLDGSVDPNAGAYNVDGSSVGSYGSPFYGVQDFGGTFDVFAELCDAVRACPAGPRTADLLTDLLRDIRTASTEWFDGWDERVTRQQVGGIITSAMYNTDLWAPLGVALGDADDGDASTLAALGSFLEAGYPRVSGASSNLTEANVAIYCADFAGRRGAFAVRWCAGWPETAEPLPQITAVDVTTPIVVIGTDGDPATPGFLAPRMADALGDAVSIRWEGAGHTAFLNSDCVDAMVVDYLIDLIVPTDRARCDFTDDVDTTVARARQVFTIDRDHYAQSLRRVFVAEGLDVSVAVCVADRLAGDAPESVLVYARLGVQRPEYTRLRTRLEAECAATDS